MSFDRVLEATGFMIGGRPAPGVRLGADAQRMRRGRAFEPDASWQAASALTVYFKFTNEFPNDRVVSSWHREIWNEGFAPLLWLISPDRIHLYNGFSRPRSPVDAQSHLIRTFDAVDRQLDALDDLAGRLSMETGHFWQLSKEVDRRTSVDEQLLSDLAFLERDLVRAGLDGGGAQGLIGRSVFAQYLVDRGIVPADRLLQVCGAERLSLALRDSTAAARLFEWLESVFNGDMFPGQDQANPVCVSHFSLVADFLDAVDPQSGQRTFFPYEFDVIPVELISSIYEQFAHSKSLVGLEKSNSARTRGVHFTRLPVVSLILDEVMDGLSGSETVLDLTCGSGVFLVEALRRLVERKCGDSPSRDVIRSTLYEQIFGVDLSAAAVRVAAFSLYLAALELDPDPQPPEALKFEGLIGRTLVVGDANEIGELPEGQVLRQANGQLRSFDVIVGNPPWTFRGKTATKERASRITENSPRQPRGEGLDFVLRATDFGHSTTRYGIVLSAMPFFAGSKTGAAAARYVVEQLSPVTIVNLSSLTKWLFPTAHMPAVVLLARHRQGRTDELTVVNVPWSASAERTFTFEVAPSDVTTLSIDAWASCPERLKTAAFGRNRDMLLLDNLRARYDDLDTWLVSIGSTWRDGLIMGKVERRTRSARHLLGLEILGKDSLEPFRVAASLQEFVESTAQWPRVRDTYRAPLLLVKEFLKGGARPIAAVADHDLVFTEAYFGAAVPLRHRDSARLVAAILSSAFASWFFLMTAAEYGVWKRRLFVRDVGLLPVPDPFDALSTSAGRKILDLENEFRNDGVTPSGWEALDEAVFELYELDDVDRLVVSDGFERAGWQWAEGRNKAAAPPSADDLVAYANAFMAGVDAWLVAAGRRHLYAEILGLPHSAAMRVVRFVVAEGRREPAASVVSTDSDLTAVLERMSEKLGVQLSSSIVGKRELRVHGESEVLIIKPSSRRFWSPSSALADADNVVAESFVGAQS